MVALFVVNNLFPHCKLSNKKTVLWYRIWSDTFIEQGAYSTNKTSTQTVTFMKAFKKIPSLNTTIITARMMSSLDGEIFVRSVSLNKFVFGSRLVDCTGWSWYACGY